MDSPDLEKQDVPPEEKDAAGHDATSTFADKQSIPGETEQLQRNLKSRHIQMIAIGSQ
jgi:amino acid permease